MERDIVFSKDRDGVHRNKSGQALSEFFHHAPRDEWEERFAKLNPLCQNYIKLTRKYYDPETPQVDKNTIPDEQDKLLKSIIGTPLVNELSEFLEFQYKQAQIKARRKP